MTWHPQRHPPTRQRASAPGGKGTPVPHVNLPGYRSAAYLVSFTSGVELEVSNCREEELARMLAAEHLRRTHRAGLITGVQRK